MVIKWHRQMADFKVWLVLLLFAQDWRFKKHFCLSHSDFTDMGLALIQFNIKHILWCSEMHKDHKCLLGLDGYAADLIQSAFLSHSCKINRKIWRLKKNTRLGNLFWRSRDIQFFQKVQHVYNLSLYFSSVFIASVQGCRVWFPYIN